MKKEKLHIVSMFHLNANIAGKDMFLAPMYIGQHLNANVELVYPKADFNKEFVDEYRGVKLTPIKSGSQYHCTFKSEKEMGWWLIKNARRIDVLALFWLNPRNLIFARIYKFLNPKGVCYIKGDFNEVQLSTNNPTQGGLKWRIKEFLHRAIDVISAEAKRSVDLIEEGAFGPHLARKVVHMPNAFDTELFEKSNIKVKAFDQKENLIITVGRIGSKQKNNEMMLRILDGVDMGSWKIIMIGPVEDSFRSIYNDFIAKNPDKVDKVILGGLVNDKNELWEIYNKAKVFMLTSTFEGFANVLVEALYFGNYILSTKVGGTYDVSDAGRLGKLIDIEDEISFKTELISIIAGNIDIKSNAVSAVDLANNTFVWNRAVMQTAERIKKVYDEKHS